MPLPLQIALSVGPLALYFFVLGAWQSGRDPKVVRGGADFALLIFGIGGLLCFGPVGRVIVSLLFPGPSVWAWLALPTSLALLALPFVPRAQRRLVVYNVTPSAFEQAVRGAVSKLPGSFARTLRGFENSDDGRGVWFDASPRSRTGVVEGHGRSADDLVRALAPLLRRELRGQGTRSSGVARAWFTMSGLLLWVPVIALMLSRVQLRAAFRALLERLH
jgi:hypothetical protein